MATTWTRLTGINGYSDAPNDIDKFSQVNMCGKSCRLWRDSEKLKLADVTGMEVIRIMAKYVEPRIYDVLFQLFDRETQHTHIENWFGTACCGVCAEAKAYRDYINDKL